MNQPIIPELHDAQVLPHISLLVNQRIIRAYEKQSISSLDHDARMALLSGIPAEERTKYTQEILAEVKIAWQEFAKSYIGNNEDTAKAKNIKLLYDIAFGEGAGKYLQNNKLTDENNPTLKYSVLPIFTHICRANSEVSRKEGENILNRVLIASLISQWIALASKPEYSLYPPQLRAKKGVDKEGREKIEIRRTAILHSAEGMVLSRGLYNLSASFCEAVFTDVVKRNPKLLIKRTEDDLLSESIHNFYNALFSYTADGGAQFSTWLTNNIRLFLAKRLVRGDTRVSRQLENPNSTTPLFDPSEYSDPTDPFYHRSRRQPKILSLDIPMSEGSGENTITAAAPDADNPFEIALRRDIAPWLKSAINGEKPDLLNSKEALVLRLRYGLDNDGKSRTLEEVGEIIKLTRERVRQIQECAITKLKKYALAQEPHTEWQHRTRHEPSTGGFLTP